MDDPWPFYAKPVLPRPEQVVYHRLLSALPGHIVLCQVQASRVLGVKRGHQFQAWNNRINRLSYDFVVCRPDATVLAAVELDDASDARSDRRGVDCRKDKATAASAAGIRLVRWHVSRIPDESVIRRDLLPYQEHRLRPVPAAAAN